MTAKEFVRSKYPKSRANKYKTNGGETYWLITDRESGRRLSEGSTELNAWVTAKLNIQGIEIP